MKRWLLAITLACLGSSPAFAQIAESVTDRPPSPNATQVKTGVYYIDISDIDSSAETFTATAYLVLEWNDPRLKFEAKGDNRVRLYKPEDIWTPGAEIVNTGKLDDQQTPLCTVVPDGTVFLQRRVVAVLNSQMDLRDFPFDRQQLNFIIETSSRYGNDEVVFVPDPDQSGLDKTIVSRGWTYGTLTSKAVAQPFAQTGQTYSRLVFSFEAKRNASFYAWKIIFPIAIFVLLTWSIFWMQVHDVQTALLISITVLLTAVAFGNVTDALLPRVGYRTLLDEFQLGSFIFIVFTVIESITVNAFHLDGQTDRAIRIRKVLRIVFPTAYALFCVVIFHRHLLD